MWTRENGSWTKYKFEQKQENYRNELETFTMFQKCVHANAYSLVDNLENIYNLFDYYSLDNYSEYNNTIQNFYSPNALIENNVNIHQIDAASIINIDINLEYINPIIDNVTLKNNHLVLLKDQTNLNENGIYKFIDNKFVQINYLENYDDRINFTCYIKLGEVNKNKQFILDRNVLSLYPADNENKTFKEGHNYVIKNKFEYKNLNDIDIHKIDVKKGTFTIENISIRHNKSGTGEIVLTNIPASTLPSVAGQKIYVTIIGHSDPVFTANNRIEILSETTTPSGPNFDHTYTTNIIEAGAASSDDIVDILFEYDVSFAVGEFGMLIKDSSDFTNGRTTELLNYDRNRLRDVQMMDDGFNNFTNYLFCVGNNGTFLKSIDAGNSFTKTVIDNTHLHCVNFYNNNIGIAAGEEGNFYSTEDGGLTWRNFQTELNDQKTINSIKLLSTDSAIALSNRGLFYSLNKNNETNQWSITKIPLVREETFLISYAIVNDLNDIVYDGTYYYVCGSSGLLLRISNTLELAFIYDPSVTVNFKSIDISDSGEIILAGEDNDIYTISSTISLVVGSNVVTSSFTSTSYTYNYEDDHKYYDVKKSKITDNLFSVANHTFYKINNLFVWEDVYTNLFDDVKSKIIVLDYKLGRKMYFIDNDGDVITPNQLYNILTPNTLLDGIDFNTLVNGDTITFTEHMNENNFWKYYKNSNLFDPVTLTSTNDFEITNNITDYTYSADNIVDGGNTDFVVNEDHILLKLTNETININAGDLIRVTIKETVPSYATVLDHTFMVISFDGTFAKINEVMSDTIQNDFYNGPYPFSMEVKNLNFLEEGNLTNIITDLNHYFFDFYEFSEVSSLVNIKAKNESISSYFNMRLSIEISTGDDYLLNYKDSDLSFIYGPNYNLLDLLNNVDNTIFIPAKTFIMPQNSFSYESSSLSTSQFVFSGNKIILGTDHTSLFESYYENTFIDIVHSGTDILTRVLILKKETEIVNGLTRHYIYFDNYIQDLVALHSITSGDSVELNSRNTLEQISFDLTRGDDLSHDIFNLISTDNINERSYKENLATFNTDNYMKIISQDSDIKDHITAIIYSNKKHDLAVNVLNFNDYSFNYEPVDLYDMGVDEIPKLGNLIKQNNIDTYIAVNTKTGRRIFDIDFSKYNFRLVDGLNLVTLSKLYPWVLDAEIENATIGQDENGLVWYIGDWYCGIWNDGTWYSGTFHDGIWNNGTWNSVLVNAEIRAVLVKTLTNRTYSIWKKGTWIDGTWNNGTHFDGTWNDGTWNDGLWLNGQFDIGTWNNGEWQGGYWINGIFNNGSFSMENSESIWFFGYWYGGDFKNGLWKSGFFNQRTVNALSRFGTESTFQLRSIWENGSFINGEIHCYANNVDGDIYNPLNSEQYEYTIFHAGTILSCSCYGATFKQGNWRGGIMNQGYIDAKIPVDTDDFSITGNVLTLKINNYENYLKVGDEIHIIGEYDATHLPSPITNTHEEIGYNESPGTHIIHNIDSNGDIEILLENPLITDIDDTNGAYVDLSIVFATHNGTWNNSLWNGGLWLGGTWLGGMWLDGIWDNGVWGDLDNPMP